MWGILSGRGRWRVAVSALCVVMVLVMGTVQAVHSHGDDAKTARHTCSICSISNAKLDTTQVAVAPLMSAAPMVSVEASALGIFRPATTNFVRPPPAV